MGVTTPAERLTRGGVGALFTLGAASSRSPPCRSAGCRSGNRPSRSRLIGRGRLYAVASSHLRGVGVSLDATNVRLRSTAVLQVLGSGGGSEIVVCRAAGLTRWPPIRCVAGVTSCGTILAGGGGWASSPTEGGGYWSAHSISAPRASALTRAANASTAADK
jgi:hypothetical protein